MLVFAFFLSLAVAISIAISFGRKIGPIEICLAPQTVLNKLPANLESRVQQFDRLINPSLEEAARTIQKAKFIIGIPYFNEEEAIAKLVHRLIEALVSGELERLINKNERVAIIVVGEAQKAEALRAVPVEQAKYFKQIEVVRFAKPEGFTRKPWTIRAFLKLSRQLNSHYVSIDADVDAEVAVNWINRLMSPVLEDRADFVSPNSIRSFNDDDAPAHMLDYLLAASVYGTKLHQRHGGEFAVHRAALNSLIEDPSLSYENICCLEGQLASRAVLLQLRLAEVHLGKKLHKQVKPEDLFTYRFPLLVRSLFGDLLKHRSYLAKLAPLNVTVIGESEGEQDIESILSPAYRDLLFELFKQGLNRHKDFYKSKLPKEVVLLLEKQTEKSPGGFTFGPDLWANTTFLFLDLYSKANPEEQIQISEAYIPLWQAAIIHFANRVSGGTYQTAQETMEQDYLAAFEFVASWKNYSKRILHDGLPPKILEQSLSETSL